MASSAGRGERVRVFIDSSVLIAAAISSIGSAHDLLGLGLDGTIHLHVSSLVLQETQRNLARNAPRALPLFVERFQPALLSQVTDTSPLLVVEVTETIAAEDAPIVDAALTARATYLTSHDRKHLLNQVPQIQSSFGLTVTIPDQIIRNL
jgi:predicted nucleic acid-binding protein